MAIKNLVSLTIDDLIEHPIWYFPGDEIDGDEFSIKPATKEIIEKGLGFILRTDFVSFNNNKFIGFIHHQAPYTLDALQPAVIFEDNYILYFWKGMFLPDDVTMDNIKQKTPKGFFPLKYKSVEGFQQKTFKGVLKGLYHFDMKKNIVVKKYS